MIRQCRNFKTLAIRYSRNVSTLRPDQMFGHNQSSGEPQSDALRIEQPAEIHDQVQQLPKGDALLRDLASKLFKSQYETPIKHEPLSSSELKPLDINFPADASTSSNTRITKTKRLPPYVTSTLMWDSCGLNLCKSDFQRILPPLNRRVGNYEESVDHDMIEFEVVRSRCPKTLVAWPSHFLIFESRIAAYMYYMETRGADICGLEPKFRFVTQLEKGLKQPLLEAHPEVPRSNCAIIYGIPRSVRPWQIQRVLRDYEFVFDDKIAIERLPTGIVKYGGAPYLLRFASEIEARRAVSHWNRRHFPVADQKVYLELLD